MLYEMIAGRQPFRGETINHIIVAILEQEPPPLAPEVPAQLYRILKQALAKNVEERYPNAQALLADLKRLQTRWLVEAENKRDSTDNERAEAHTMTLDEEARPRTRHGRRRPAARCQHLLTNRRQGSGG